MSNVFPYPGRVMRGSSRSIPKLPPALPVRSGTHTVRVRVNAPNDVYDRDTSIPGNFTAYSQKTLLLNFKNKNLSLNWE